MTARSGFTLLELLLAAALSAVLMVGVLGVVARSDGLIVSEPQLHQTDAAFERFSSLLAEDLQHASTVNASRTNRLRLTGPAGLNRSDRRRSHGWVEVVYSLETLAGERWIVRRQADLTDLTSDHMQVDLVYRGVANWSVRAQTFRPRDAFAPDPLLFRVLPHPSEQPVGRRPAGTAASSDSDRVAAREERSQAVEGKTAQHDGKLRVRLDPGTGRLHYAYGDRGFSESLPPEAESLARQFKKRLRSGNILQGIDAQTRQQIIASLEHLEPDSNGHRQSPNTAKPQPRTARETSAVGWQDSRTSASTENASALDLTSAPASQTAWRLRLQTTAEAKASPRDRLIAVTATKGNE